MDEASLQFQWSATWTAHDQGSFQYLKSVRHDLVAVFICSALDKTYTFVFIDISFPWIVISSVITNLARIARLSCFSTDAVYAPEVEYVELHNRHFILDTLLG